MISTGALTVSMLTGAVSDPERNHSAMLTIDIKISLEEPCVSLEITALIGQAVHRCAILSRIMSRQYAMQEDLYQQLKPLSFVYYSIGAAAVYWLCLFIFRGMNR